MMYAVLIELYPPHSFHGETAPSRKVLAGPFDTKELAQEHIDDARRQNLPYKSKKIVELCEFYTFWVAASGHGIVEPALGQGTLAEGVRLVHNLYDKYEDWVRRGHPEEKGLHTVWEGSDISAHPDGGGIVLFYDDDSDTFKEL